MKTKFTRNIFMEKAHAICITTNGIVKNNGEAVMGAGIAKQANQRYMLAPRLGQKLKLYGNHCYDMGIYDGKAIVTFPTKNHWKDNSSIELIEQSCRELVAMADKNAWTSVMLPPIGCGLGGLDFETQVRPVIENILDDRFTICFLDKYVSPHVKTNGAGETQNISRPDKRVEHEGYVITQCGLNNHVMISKDGKMMFHAGYKQDFTEEELVTVVFADYLRIDAMTEEFLKLKEADPDRGKSRHLLP